MFRRIDSKVLIYHRNTEDLMRQHQPNGTQNIRISMHPWKMAPLNHPSQSRLQSQQWRIKHKPDRLLRHPNHLRRQHQPKRERRRSERGVRMRLLRKEQTGSEKRRRGRSRESRRRWIRMGTAIEKCLLSSVVLWLACIPSSLNWQGIWYRVVLLCQEMEGNEALRSRYIPIVFRECVRCLAFSSITNSRTRTP